jgi:hypothetical protein
MIEAAIASELPPGALLIDYVVYAVAVDTDGEPLSVSLVRPGSYPHSNLGLAEMLRVEMLEAAQ